MSEGQKVIKYCAMAFAAFLAISIITGIIGGAVAIVSAISGGTIKTGSNETIDFTDTFTGVKSLDIDNSSGNLKILVGDEFKVEAVDVNENFKAEVKNGKLTISDDDNEVQFLWFNINGVNSPNSKITLYLPADFVAEKVKLDSGAGNITMEGLKTDKLIISAGAGNIDGNGIIADEVKIDGGVGNITLSDVNLTDGDFDCGVGNLSIDGILLGQSKFDCGVGNVNLDLTGNVDDYNLNIDTGVGSVRLNGKKISSDEYINNRGDNLIKIDGGVGDVKINIGE